MTAETRTFIEESVQEAPVGNHRIALDVGSKEADGGIITDLFDDFLYVGLDMVAGSNVDLIANSHNLPFGDDSITVLVSSGTLEHDRAFWLSRDEIRRVLCPGGLLIVIVPSLKFAWHQWPIDWWRFSKEAVEDYFLEDFMDKKVIGNGLVFGKGRKPC